MTQYYESEVLFNLMERDGFNIPSSVPPYEAEIKAYLINQVKPAYPKLMDYEAEWLLYNYTIHVPADFPISSVSNVTEATFENVVPFVYQSAILKGNTKYRDIDTGEFLETFEEGRNLELVSVQMPVLTTSNGDGTRTNILTVNEDVVLRGIGDVKDTLDCLTGEYVQRIGEVKITDEMIDKFSIYGNFIRNFNIIFDGLEQRKIETFTKNSISMVSDKMVAKAWIDATMAENVVYFSQYSDGDMRAYHSPDWTLDEFKAWFRENKPTIQYKLATPTIKTVELTTVNENGESVHFIPLEGTMNVHSSGEIIQPTFDMSVPVEATTQNLASFIDLEMEE